MIKNAWAELKPKDLATLKGFLDGMPEKERPLYGLMESGGWILSPILRPRTSVKAWLTASLGMGAIHDHLYVVLFTKDKIVFSQGRSGCRNESKRRKYAYSDLKVLSVRHGIFTDSAFFRFSDGFHFRMRTLPKTQVKPVQRLSDEGITVFDYKKLSAEQHTNNYYPFAIMRILPRNLL